MNKVHELTPGDLVKNDAPPGLPDHAVFIAETMHPIWPHLRLVIWKLSNGTWSFDALNRLQDIGQIEPSDAAARIDRLRLALLGTQGGPRPADHGRVRT